MKRAFFVAAGLALGVVSASAATASAANQQAPYHCTEATTAVIDPGTFKFTGQVVHLLGQHVVKLASGDLYCAGAMDIAGVDTHFNQQTGKAVVTGTYRVDLAGVRGGFDVTFEAHGAVEPSGALTWVSRNVGHGFGALEGWQLRGTTTRNSSGQFFDDGFVFQPGS